MIQTLQCRTETGNPGIGGFFFPQHFPWQFRKTIGNQSDSGQPQNFDILFFEIAAAQLDQTPDFRSHADSVEIRIDQPGKRGDLKIDIQLRQHFIRMGAEMDIRRDQIHLIRIQRDPLFPDHDRCSAFIMLVEPPETCLQILVIPVFRIHTVRGDETPGSVFVKKCIVALVISNF